MVHQCRGTEPGMHADPRQNDVLEYPEPASLHDHQGDGNACNDRDESQGAEHLAPHRFFGEDVDSESRFELIMSRSKPEKYRTGPEVDRLIQHRKLFEDPPGHGPPIGIFFQTICICMMHVMDMLPAIVWIKHGHEG